ncbi:sulfotransferase family protein [Thiosocius teredinicola]|uniref:sulfotransferase family protein n=1 Tax=Thiosocius teredinicola TaxID=1973002 RepID=UPI0009914BBA
MTAPFLGPLFIVGLSRSGTKLIRDLLNRHPHIAIPVAETHFLPHLFERIIGDDVVPTSPKLRQFEELLSGSTFLRRLQQRGSVPDWQQLKQAFGRPTWLEVIEQVLRLYAGSADDARVIWGDKTPRYLAHMRLLKHRFPQARFLHIVRDPRDRALSVRQAWGGNLYLSADDWRQSLMQAARDAQALGSDYKTIRYEDLLTYPEQTMRSVCKFLDIDFSPDTLVLDRPVENLGDPDDVTRKQSTIVASNVGRFHDRLNTRQRRRIEQIVFPIARQLGSAPTVNDLDHRPPRWFERAWWLVPHGWNNVAFHVRRWGLVAGLRHGFLRIQSKR